ncbi:MAG: hypothetical protein WC330_02055 [Candidatus Omnitrophota bacterium]|jgi:uncharacterized protein HemX
MIDQTPKAKDQRQGVNKKIKAQSVLESTVAYAAVMAVLGAAMGVFGWGIAHIPARQATYEATRIMAGSPRGRNVSEQGAQQTNSMAVWPTYLAGGGVASAF